VNAIWQLFLVLASSINAGRIREQVFEFLGRPGRLTFYIPRLSINVVAKFPGILTERAGFARLICRSSAYRLRFQSAFSQTLLKLWRNLTEVFYRCFLAILHGVILAKYDVFINFYIFRNKTALQRVIQ